jgi:hypothetical protein
MRGTCLKLIHTVTLSVVKFTIVKVHVVKISVYGSVRITEFYTKKLEFLVRLTVNVVC